MKKFQILVIVLSIAIGVTIIGSCTKSDTPIPPKEVVIDPKPLGKQFIAVKALMDNKCAECHKNGNIRGGFSFVDPLNIVVKSARIVDRAVTKGDMPQGAPLSDAEKKIITDWITGGGKETN